MLSTFVSAPTVEYQAADFFVYAMGECEVYEYGVGTFSGEGRLYLKGLVKARQEADHYWAYTPDDPNTHIWIQRGLMKVTWDGEMLVIYMWSSYTTIWLWDAGDILEIEYLDFAGCYKNSSDHPQFIWGTVDAGFYNETHLQFISVYIFRGPELYLEFDFTWYCDEAQSFKHAVTTRRSVSVPGWWGLGVWSWLGSRARKLRSFYE
ncbi:MAG: hypothetical protein JSW53_03185 [Candidatus Bathyarchaeota archaeon]|nr:MAG: hypothetical protein JSW53_03185 [Candidatus Bathyarchaeota archaeon]